MKFPYKGSRNIFKEMRESRSLFNLYRFLNATELNKYRLFSIEEHMFLNKIQWTIAKKSLFAFDTI